MELIDGAKGLLAACIDTSLPFCKYFHTSSNSVASVAKLQTVLCFSLSPLEMAPLVWKLMQELGPAYFLEER